MVSAGARSETEEQITGALGLADLPSEDRQAAYGSLGQSLQGGKDVDLDFANGLWSQSGYGVAKPFLKTLTSDYDAGLGLEDFVGNPDAARSDINERVKKQTDGLIDELLPADSLSELTRLVVTNAIHFQARWKTTFSDYGEGKFNRLDGSTTKVPYMSKDGPLKYLDADGYQAVELPYRGGQYSMMLIVPDAGSFEDVEGQLSPDFLATTSDAVETVPDGILTMPPFEIATSSDLSEPLKSLGIEDAFDPDAADFSGINPDAVNDGLRLSGVFHDAVIQVDKDGTEAAAATGAVFQALSAPVGGVNLQINRPFIYALRSRDTGALLFLGRVLDPSA